jgi:hypothetical protein
MTIQKGIVLALACGTCVTLINIEFFNPGYSSVADVFLSLENFKSACKKWVESKSCSRQEVFEKISENPLWIVVHQQMTEAKKNNCWFLDAWSWGICENAGDIPSFVF